MNIHKDSRLTPVRREELRLVIGFLPIAAIDVFSRPAASRRIVP